MQGKIKWFNNEKGFGFIQLNETQDVFVHYTAIKMDGYKTLREGDEISYELIETPKGLQALNVRLIKELQATNN